MFRVKKALTVLLAVLLIVSFSGAAFAADVDLQENAELLELESDQADEAEQQPSDPPVEDPLLEEVEAQPQPEEQTAQTPEAGAQDILALAQTDGAAAAALLEQYPDEEYELLLKDVLDYYYGVDSTQLAAFSAGLSARAAQVLQNYEQAYAQRCADDLMFVPGEVLVAFAPKTDEVVMLAMAEELDASEMQLIETPAEETIILAQASLGQTVEQAVEQFEAQPGVLFAQPNYIYQQPEVTFTEEPLAGAQAISNDEGVDGQWHLGKINVQAAWDAAVSKGVKNKVRVAVLDGAADIYHKDLQKNMNSSLARDTSLGKLTSYPTSGFDRHGTHVCGIIGADANNSIGVAGVASGANNNIVEIIPVNVFRGSTATTSAIVTGLNWAVRCKVKVINLSLGGYYQDTMERNAIKSAVNNGVTVVCAAGNDGTQQNNYPSDYPETISVIATKDYYSTDNLSKADFSNYGSAKDISAPGVRILSSVPGNMYSYADGTSMAAPVVSAVAAMVLYRNPNLTPAQVEQILETTATDLYTSGFDIYTAWGNVNASKAVQKAVKVAAPPAKPASLSAVSAGISSIRVSWKKVSAASGYIIYRSTSKNGTYKQVKKITTKSTVAYTDKNLIKGKTYYYKVRSYKGSQKSTLAAGPIASRPMANPVKPSGLKAKSTGYNSVAVSWKKVSNSSGYILYRSTSKSSGFKQIKKFSSANSLTYADKNLKPGTTYYYRVQAYKGIQKSANAGPVSVKPVVAAPKKVVAKAAGKSGIRVSWTKAEGASGYVVYYSAKKASGYKAVATLKAGTQTYTHTGLSPLQRGYYKVAAYRAVGSNKMRGKSSVCATAITSSR